MDDLLFSPPSPRSLAMQRWWFLYSLNRSMRSTSFTSSMVALLLSFDSLIALFPLWVVGRERLPSTRMREKVHHLRQIRTWDRKEMSKNRLEIRSLGHSKPSARRIIIRGERHVGAYLRSTALRPPTTKQSAWFSSHRSAFLHLLSGQPNLEIDPSTILSFSRASREMFRGKSRLLFICLIKTPTFPNR